MPNQGQIALLVLADALFVIGGIFSLLRLRRNSNALRIACKSCLYWGLCVALAVLIWHSIMRGRWIPLGDNFDELIWLAVMLVAFAGYVQRSRPLAALDWFVLPIVVIMLACAAVFGRTEYRSYAYQSYGGAMWTYVHHLSSYFGAAAFAIAASTGSMYILAARKLRSKQSVAYLGSLERLERISMAAVTLGFALLTICLITGAVEMIEQNVHVPGWKISVAGTVWVLYAIVLHAPINPIFRGRRSAVLSVLGFVLLIGTLIAMQFGSAPAALGGR
jgi:ABC-type transport system involved in cytochrome c biogenesis permease subunit